MTALANQKTASGPQAGDKAPDFALPADGGKTVSLNGLKGRNVVLYFYPKDDTPGCTVEAKDFKDHLKDFEAVNTVILGVSRDSVESHDKFREKYCLPFTLVSDESGKTCEDYGVWVEKSMYGKSFLGVERATFLIDRNGVVRNVWRKVKVDGHVKEVLAAAKRLD